MTRPSDAYGREIGGYVPHHIVLAEGGGPVMERLRRDLSNWGIDLDSASNGVWLPTHRSPNDSTTTGSYHNRLHNDVYFEEVDRRLRQATDRQEAIDILGQIRNELASGTFPGTRPRTRP